MSNWKDGLPCYVVDVRTVGMYERVLWGQPRVALAVSEWLMEICQERYRTGNIYGVVGQFLMQITPEL